MSHKLKSLQAEMLPPGDSARENFTRLFEDHHTLPRLDSFSCAIDPITASRDATTRPRRNGTSSVSPIRTLHRDKRFVLSFEVQGQKGPIICG
jgi:hypothetical protein